MTSFRIDSSEVDRLTVDLSQADRRVVTGSLPTMKKAAESVKRRMQNDFRGHDYAPGLQGSLEVEQRDARGLAYEIGELNSAGPYWGIAAILAYGTSNNAPKVDHTASLRRVAPQLEKNLGDVAEDSVLGREK